MTIFLTGSCVDTADDLDYKRLNNQIKECNQLINEIEHFSNSENNPYILMYKDYIEWIELYRDCLISYNEKDYSLCQLLSLKAEKIKPHFICEELYTHYKKQLYTEDPALYSGWEHLGQTFANYYYIDGNWWRYENDKKEIDNNFIKKPNT